MNLAEKPASLQGISPLTNPDTINRVPLTISSRTMHSNS